MSEHTTGAEKPARADSKPALLVLGMHRSGTSAITGALGISGAWVGEETELTSPNSENPQGFWERRDVRQLCDELLHAAGADWWKIAEFDSQAIALDALAKQRREFKKIVASLAEYDTWAVKEPRLCLLLPVLQDYIHNPVCIHIYRNPVEVARSLQVRDGFSISAGLALWEAYNLHALNASRKLPRILVDHQSLMLSPVETLSGLVDKLDEFGLDHPINPDTKVVERFIDPRLYRQQASEEETREYLLPSQLALWSSLKSGKVLDHDTHSISQATRRQLLDFESTRLAMSRQQEETRRLVTDLHSRGKTIDELSAGMKSRAAAISELNAKLEQRARAIQSNERTIGELNAGMKSRAAAISELNARLEQRARAIQSNERTIGELNAGMKSRAAAISELNARLEQRTRTIQNNERIIGELSAGMKSRAAAIETRDRMIGELLHSTSWKVTRPLRALSSTSRRSAKKLRQTFGGSADRKSNRTAQATQPATIVGKPPAPETEKPDPKQHSSLTRRLGKLIAEHREAWQSRPAHRSARNLRIDNKSKTKVTVIAWDLGHNPLGRAYLLADVLRNDYDVELLGAHFPRFGNEIWKPLRTCSRVTVKSFPGANFPEHFNSMEDIARQIEGDIIYVSKPRLPSLELAMLAKLERNRPVILDVDDHELGFFRNRRPLSLEEVKALRHKQDFKCPHDEIWTRYSESLVPLFDHITVSGEALRKKFRGHVLPHIRDEYEFDPAAYPRDLLRAELGFTPEDRIILFAGTPRMHKGIAEIFAALKKLDRPHYKLAVVGNPVDREARRFFDTCSPEDVTLIPDIPFRDLPGYLCVADLICLIQARGEAVSDFQTPAKFTDGLSMGIPILASSVPPLQHLAQQGLVELLDDAPLERKIDEIFSNYVRYKSKAMRNRKVFARKYSYGAHLPELRAITGRLLADPPPVPDAFRELIAYHRDLFADTARLPRVTAKVVVDRRDDNQPAVRRRPHRTRPSATTGDDMDILFFWKQNDTGIYGRRQDMLVKYLSKDHRVHRIFHFDASLNVFGAGKAALHAGQAGRYSHARLVFRQTVARKLHLKNTDKVRFDTFIHGGAKRRVPRFMKRVLPCEKDYLEFLDHTIKRHKIGRRRTVFWVCPNNFDFPSITDRFQPDLVVADVIDDQRKWSIEPSYLKKLEDNYQEVLARSDLAFANCRSVFESMQSYTSNIHLFPNAAEILEDEARHWSRPSELRSMEGPVIGYVGNLDISRIDLELLTATAAARPDWNLVFIGSMHQNKDLLSLDRFKNVHFLGVRLYETALRYIRHFDVAIVPHLDNPLTRNMNPLKLYVYLALHVPVVITPIANADEFQAFIKIGRTPAEFIERIGDCLENDTIAENLDSFRRLLEANSWDRRVAGMLSLIEAEFARR